MYGLIHIIGQSYDNYNEDCDIDEVKGLGLYPTQEEAEKAKENICKESSEYYNYRHESIIGFVNSFKVPDDWVSFVRKIFPRKYWGFIFVDNVKGHLESFLLDGRLAELEGYSPPTIKPVYFLESLYVVELPASGD